MRRALLVMGVVMVVTLETSGQAPVLRPAREMLVAGPAELSDVELADLDGDGDLDLYTDGKRFQDPPVFEPKLHLYDDLGGFRELSGAVDPAVGGELGSDLAFADLDGDGDLDAYRVSSFATHDEVLVGDGTGTLVLAPATPSSSGLVRAVALADLDLDGDIDAVADDTSISGPVTTALRVQVNGGSLAFSTFSVPLLPQSPGLGGDIAAGDVDADGLPDLVVTTGAYPLLVRNGPGLALAYAPGAITLDATSQEVELGDLDGDGDLDLASGTIDQGGSFQPDTSPDLVYAGDGLGGFTLAAALPGGAHPTTALDLDDLDGDGDLDVALAFAANVFTDPAGQSLLRNDGGFAFTRVPAALESLASYCGGLALGDVDQDGDSDLVLDSNSMQARLLLGDGALGFAEVTTALPWSGADGAFLLADLDGDRDLDGWASLAEGQVQRNVGNGVLVPDPAATAGAIPPVPGGGNSAVAFDVNGDGSLDIYQSRGPELKDKLYVNGGSGTFTLGSINNTSSLTAAAGDVDGDGDKDVVLDGNSILFGDGSGGFLWWPLGPGSAKVAALGDLDLDGDLDVARGFNGPAEWSPFTGPGFGASQPLGVDIIATDVEVSDLDADGDSDVLFASFSGPALLRNEGAGVFTDVSAGLPAPAASYGQNPRVAVADLDGDADRDFVATSDWPFSPEQYFVFLNQSGGVFADGTALVHSPIDVPRELALGDIDADGDVDVVATEFPGRLRVLTNHARQLAWRGLPRAGKDIALDVSGPAGEPWALATSLGQASIPLAPYGWLHLDPAGLHVVASGVLDGAGQAAAVGLMPPGAAGLTVYCQAIVGFAPRLTNLELVTLTAY